LKLLGQIMRQIMILVTIEMSWGRWWTKRILWIWIYSISRKRRKWWDWNVPKVKGCNGRKNRILGNPTLFRAIQVTIVSFILSCSGTCTLWGVRRCFGPI